jgi:hypothetical protein
VIAVKNIYSTAPNTNQAMLIVDTNHSVHSTRRYPSRPAPNTAMACTPYSIHSIERARADVTKSYKVKPDLAYESLGQEWQL